MKHFQWTLVQATVRHVRANERNPDKLGVALFYLACVAGEFQRAGRYDISYQARALRARIEQDRTLKHVYGELKAMYGDWYASVPPNETPASNTGVKSPVQETLEGYVGYER